MTVSASEQLAQRYSLQLSAGWRAWFDEDVGQLGSVGQFHVPVELADLITAAPKDVWPGFMLPDTLPFLSNDYGDWWCLRVGSTGHITEVIQWLHGGGDYLPVGKNLAEAVLWDHLQPWRCRASGSRPAAHEYPPRPDPLSTDRREWADLEPWLARHLVIPSEVVRTLIQTAEAGGYRQALTVMLERDWARWAVAFELIELDLQGSLALLADSPLAGRGGIEGTPETTNWLFDTDQIPAEARGLLRQSRPEIVFDQDWQSAAGWAEPITRQRPDLGWAGDVAGWAAERRGELERAVGYYFQNRYASAFTDQSVRLRSHWFADRYGKFSVAQLARLQSRLSTDQQSDAYLQLLWQEPPDRTRAAIREFWLAKATGAMQASEFAAAYEFYFQAGWDLGAERLSDYAIILDGLASSARGAGWHAREAIALTHAECLRRRLSLP